MTRREYIYGYRIQKRLIKKGDFHWQDSWVTPANELNCVSFKKKIQLS